jgi:hypothetical protein
VQTKSPHGPAFKVSCSTCHSAKGWQIDKNIYSFDHSTTKLPLEGQHTEINCRLCHKSLVFTEAGTECNDCHTDIHQATVGSDCSRCHTPASWLVSNISEIHQMSRFPLLGAHKTADCFDCHKSESYARFDVLGVNCIDCHSSDYNSTTDPNHAAAGFSEDCSRCHPVNSFQWSGAGFEHSFFPLEQGHSEPQCDDCHTTGSYSDASPECNSCHLQDYNGTTNPNHNQAGFPQECNLCHTLNPGWKPASFEQHDSQAFPIYSGKHNGVWNLCTECHSNPSDYSVFTCLNCHEHNKTEMDDQHQEISGYLYDSPACLNCHPTGEAD